MISQELPRAQDLAAPEVLYPAGAARMRGRARVTG
jgi:hypothetical protein